MIKPELLLPVGNPEMFHAAIEGGANAVYLGLRQFNARGRASNFTINQLQALIKVAHKNRVKVYLTLNTVIKNEELSALLDTLYIIDQTSIDAIIIQDWGVFHLIRKHFPNQEIHASTQMANHNSLGSQYSKQVGFFRVVMARELTLAELKEIENKSDIELEIFIHGALCYSISGICLFSSFLGGSGANRGLCAQPCRRLYETANTSSYLFSLKDNQAIEVLPQLTQMGITSIKIEGRLKPAEYVYRVAQAYRSVLDNVQQITEAKELLKYDMGREKTGYFLSGNISNAITHHPNTGVLIGEVTRITPNGFEISSNHQLNKGNRLRIRPANGEIRKAFKIKAFQTLSKNLFLIENSTVQPQIGNQVYLAGLQQKKFLNKFREEGKPIKQVMPQRQKHQILNTFGSSKKPHKDQIYFRIDSLTWLRKIRLDDLDGLILNLPKKDWNDLNLNAPFLKKNAHKLIIELPKFIPERDIDYYRDLCQRAQSNGYSNFMLSHLSQKLLLPVKSRAASNENIYIFNDAAITFLRNEGINLYTYPHENDIENLLTGKDRYGIIPLYFYPQLFYSRMPIKLESDSENLLMDDQKGKYRRFIRDGITIVVPEYPVSLLQYREKLRNAGFRRFLVDLSHEKPSSNTFKRLINRLKKSEQVQPSFNFNFKKGLK